MLGNKMADFDKLINLLNFSKFQLKGTKSALNKFSTNALAHRRKLQLQVIAIYLL